MWGIGEVVNALVSASRDRPPDRISVRERLEGLRRHRELDGRRMVPPDHMPRLPLMYAIAAHREAA